MEAITEFKNNPMYKIFGDVWIVGNGVNKIKTSDGSEPALSCRENWIKPQGLMAYPETGDWVKLSKNNKNIVGVGFYVPKWNDAYKIFAFQQESNAFFLNNSRFVMGEDKQLEGVYPDGFEVQYRPKQYHFTGCLMPDGKAGFFRDGKLKTISDEKINYRLNGSDNIYIEVTTAPYQIAYTLIDTLTEESAKKVDDAIKALMLGIGATIAPPRLFLNTENESEISVILR